MKKLSFAVLSAAVFSFALAPAIAQGQPDPDLDRAHHVLRRITFGPNRALVAQLGTGLPAVQSYIAAQLAPPATSDPGYHGSARLVQLLDQVVVPGTHGTLLLPDTIGGTFGLGQVAYANFAYALESQWQLREVMTQFWERHFNSSAFAQAAYFTPHSGAGNEANYIAWVEWDANRFYRANALGTFAALLQATARHASMMVSLHMPQNDAGAMNENFARELMELYTMGPGNYDQSDVEKVMRIFTGWDLDHPGGFVFLFESGDHQYPTGPTTLFTVSGSPVTLAQVVPPAGETEGHRLLGELARRPATVDFVCRKLVREFVDESVGDLPNPPVLQAMKAAWGTQGDITAVMQALLASNEFLGTGSHLERVRLPFDAVVAAARAVDGQLRLDSFGLADPQCLAGPWLATAKQGMSLFQYPAPNGFPTDDNSQLSPSVMLERAYWGWNMLLNAAPLQVPATDMVAFVAPVQPPLPPAPTVQNVGPHYVALIDYLLTSCYGSNYTAADELRVLDGVLGAVAWIDLQTTGPLAGPWDPALPAHYQATLAAAAGTALGLVQGSQR